MNDEQMKNLGLQGTAVDLRRQAALTQYLAACMVGSDAEKLTLRDNLHSLLDLQLDSLDAVGLAAKG